MKNFHTGLGADSTVAEFTSREQSNLDQKGVPQDYVLYDERRMNGAKAIIDTAKRMAFEVGIDEEWVGIDYGLEIKCSGQHVMGMNTPEKTAQIQLQDEALIGFLSGFDTESTMCKLQSLITALLRE